MASVDTTLTSLNESAHTSQAFFTYVEDSYHDTIKDRLVSFRRVEAYTDMIIKTHHLEISCHRVIIAAGSKYFDQLFKAGPKESLQSTVVLNEVSPDVMEAIVEYFYTAKIKVTSENVQAMCLACTVLKLDKLKNACDKFMAENIAPYNCLGMYVFAKANGLDAIQKAAHECMMTRPRDILRLAMETEYQTLSEDELINYIANDDLEVEEESTVFEIVLKWVESDRPNREKSFDCVLQHVRLPFCTSEFLCNVKEVFPYTKSEKCEALIWEALKYHLMPASRHSMQSPRTCPRKYYQVDMPPKAGAVKDSNTQRSSGAASKEAWVEDRMQIVLMGGKVIDKEPNKRCWYLRKDGSTWKGFTNFPSAYTRCFRAVYTGNDIIVTGGWTVDNKKTGDCWSFNIHDKKWKSLPALQTPRGFHVMVCVGEDVYVCGGSNDSTLESCEKLDSKRQNWVYIPSLLKPSWAQAGVVYNNTIYIIGGDWSPTLTQCYSATTNTWQKKADVPTRCEGRPSAVVLHDRIYVVGGDNNVCLSYNPGQDSWTALTQPHGNHSFAQCIVWQGKIVVGGGGRTTDYTDTIEEYDTENDEWTEWKIKLPKKLRTHCMLIVPECRT